MCLSLGITVKAVEPGVRAQVSYFPESVLLTSMPNCFFRKIAKGQPTAQGMWKVRREKDAVAR